MESHSLDELDRQLLHALERDGRAAFSRIATVLGVSDQTVARRYRRLCADVGLKVIAVRDGQRLGQDQWMLRLRCTPDSAEAIATALARRPDTAWIALAAGGTEVICMTRPRSDGERDELMLGKLPRTPHIVEIRAYQMLHTFFGGSDGWLMKSGALNEAQAAELRPELSRPAGPARITPEDEPLVRALERDGRATYPELQLATGRSESAVKRRLAALLASRALYIDVEYRPEHIGFPVGTTLWITAAPAALHSVGQAIARHPEAAFVSASAGPSNLVATVLTRSTAELYAYLSGKLGTLEGIQHIETTAKLRRIKQLSVPGPAR
ncbi:Lrp/AsnC family transcriptional regulator [Streptomyces sp. NPDC001415]